MKQVECLLVGNSLGIMFPPSLKSNEIGKAKALNPASTLTSPLSSLIVASPKIVKTKVLTKHCDRPANAAEEKKSEEKCVNQKLSENVCFDNKITCAIPSSKTTSLNVEESKEPTVICVDSDLSDNRESKADNDFSHSSDNSERKESEAKKNSISFRNERSTEESDYLATRCDVIYKTILRDFRRHFQAKFKQTATYSKRSKPRFFKLTLEEFSSTIWRTHFSEELDEETVTKCISSLIHSKEIKTVHDCLYKFSIQKAMNLMRNKYYFKLFKIYHDEVKSGAAEMTPTMLKNREAYLKAYKILLAEGQTANP